MCIFPPSRVPTATAGSLGECPLRYSCLLTARAIAGVDDARTQRAPHLSHTRVHTGCVLRSRRTHSQRADCSASPPSHISNSCHDPLPSQHLETRTTPIARLPAQAISRASACVPRSGPSSPASHHCTTNHHCVKPPPRPHHPRCVGTPHTLTHAHRHTATEKKSSTTPSSAPLPFDTRSLERRRRAQSSDPLLCKLIEHVLGEVLLRVVDLTLVGCRRRRFSIRRGGLVSKRKHAQVQAQARSKTTGKRRSHNP